MHKKKILGLVFVLCFAINLFLAKNIFAEETIKIKIDDNIFYGIEKNGEVLIPVKDIFENLNMLVILDDAGINIRNSFNRVVINIEQKEVYIDWQKKVLNQAPEIINDKIFAGLELIDLTHEIFGASYEKNDNLLVINKKPGDLQVESEHYSEEKKNKSGDVLAKINYCKPIVEPRLNSAFIDKINKTLDHDIQKFSKAVDENIKDYDGDLIEYDLPPLNYESAFDVLYNKNGLLCIVMENYYNNQGIHPDTERIVHVFDLNNSKELTLSDILVDGYEDIVYNLLVDYVKKEYGDYGEETVRNILEFVSKEIENVKFYLVDNGVKIYFDVYQIGSYAMEYPTVEIKYNSNKDLFKIAI